MFGTVSVVEKNYELLQPKKKVPDENHFINLFFSVRINTQLRYIFIRDMVCASSILIIISALETSG